MNTTGRARITYYAPNRTFVWLHKEQSFKEFQNALWRKLVPPENATISVKQIHEGNTLDIDNEDEYEAFCDFARTTPAIDIRVTFNDSNVQGGTVNGQPRENQPSLVPPSAIPSLVTNQLSGSAPSLNRLEPQSSISVLQMSDRRKRKRKHITESSVDRTLVQSPSLSIRSGGSVQNRPNDAPPFPDAKQANALLTSQPVGVPGNNNAPNLSKVAEPRSHPRKKKKLKEKTESVAGASRQEPLPSENPSKVFPPILVEPLASTSKELDPPSDVPKLISKSMKRRRDDTEPDNKAVLPELKRKKPLSQVIPKNQKISDKDPTSLVDKDAAPEAIVETTATLPPLGEPQLNRPVVKSKKRKEKSSTLEETSSAQPTKTSPAIVVDEITPPIPVEAAKKLKKPQKPQVTADTATVDSTLVEVVIPSKKGTYRDQQKSMIGTLPQKAQDSVAQVSTTSVDKQPVLKNKDTDEDKQKSVIAKLKPRPRPKLPVSVPKVSPSVDKQAVPKAAEEEGLQSPKSKKTAISFTDHGITAPELQTDAPGESTDAGATEALLGDSGQSQARGKKQKKRTVKPPAPSVPTIDIQDIINQVLAKNKATPTSSEPPPTPVLGVHTLDPPEAAAPDEFTPTSPVAESSPRTSAPVPRKIETKRPPRRRKSCPICNESPFHEPVSCPVIIAGPGSIENRIAELKAKKPVARKLIQELRSFLTDSKAKKPQRDNMALDVPTSPAATIEIPSAKHPERSQLKLPGVPPPTKTVKGSDDDDSVTNLPRSHPVPYYDPDDDLDTLLRGPKEPVKKNILKELESDDHSEEEKEEREEIEVEDEEDEARKFRKLLKRYDPVESSDEGEVVNNDHESSSSEPRIDDRPSTQVISHKAARTQSDQSKVEHISHNATADGQDDEVVPPTDDEIEESQPEVQHSSVPDKSKIVSVSLPKASSIVSTTSSNHLNKPHTPIAELKSTKSSHKYLAQHLPDKPDPIQPSDDALSQHLRSSIEPADSIHDDDGLNYKSLSVPQHSSPVKNRMKTRSGRTNISAHAAKDTWIAPDMDPPPTPPWLSEENVVTKKRSARPQMTRAAESTPVQPRSQQNVVQSQSAQSLAQWAVLTQSPQATMISESSMVDELRSSPQEDSVADGAKLAPPAKSKTAVVPRPPEKGSLISRTSKHFDPDSQVPTNNDKNVSVSGSSSESETEERKTKKPPLERGRSFSSSAPYRRLTDIASLGIPFASPLQTPITPSTPFANGMDNVHPEDDEDEDEDEDDSSSSSGDSDEVGGSHIPKSRRAGVKQKKSTGLFGLIKSSLI